MQERINFIYTRSFDKQWKKIGLTDLDKEYMEKLLTDFARESRNHIGKSFLGDMIKGTGGAIKWRFSPESNYKGKSGSERVIYLILAESNYFFLDVYGKSEKENLSNEDKKAIKNLSDMLKRRFTK